MNDIEVTSRSESNREIRIMSSFNSPGRGLPVELFDKILANVSPQLPGLLSTAENGQRPRLNDLLQCRLVSHKLSSVASRWVWWRLKLELDSDTPADVTIKVDDPQGEEECVNPDFDAQTLWSYPVETLDSLGNRNVVTDIDEECEAVGRITSIQKVTHFGKICTAIASNNTITSSVRDFSLVLDTMVFFDASGDAGAAAHKILVVTIAALKNLETVTIHIKDGSYTFPIIPIIWMLLGMPSIQTVILYGVNCSYIVPGFTALKNVKNIYLRSCENVQVLLPLMPSLEVFGYANDMANDSLVITDPLPWETLRELTIESSVDVFTIRNIANNFVTWNQRDSNIRSSPLVVLVLQDHFNLDTELVTRAFRGQPLRKLSLGTIRRPMAFNSLISIVDTFPELEELSIFAEQWNGDTDEFSWALGHLKNLKSLDWNFFAEREKSEPLFSADKKVRCIPIVECLQRFCSQLSRVTFCCQRKLDLATLRFEIVGPGQDQNGTYEETTKYLRRFRSFPNNLCIIVFFKLAESLDPSTHNAISTAANQASFLAVDTGQILSSLKKINDW